MYQQTISCPLGQVQIYATDNGICEIYLGFKTATADRPSVLTKEAARQLAHYFAGSLTQFNLPLTASGTAFQQQVWRALSALPFGQTCSYADIAREIANPKAVRAVGAANGKNPIAIVVPCHRVIGSNGSLTGYAGGLTNKAWLLEHEYQITKNAQDH
ncbi:methylated-DNA--[protein]-cysteine S-methyltransferase [Arsukibacterium sp.]|uniref:methylated-DNA--[protein]-cysteine S-methyltransferase n=1 Tax=Arsukibacterium sp. TaxID=1977258 RepID=UPI00299D070F|nr:methylated-DNA--[protein]-cysteine S-methyltransferase [Arsukibacterium sp.]MDX1676986.1 methylated-DNA--[protein]-cysteine S-methyltransferase [Arsukibacterium sp.]